MVSYSTAKAEALGVEPPRGAMRRQERAVYFVLGAALVPIVAAAAHRWGLPAFVERCLCSSASDWSRSWATYRPSVGSGHSRSGAQARAEPPRRPTAMRAPLHGMPMWRRATQCAETRGAGLWWTLLRHQLGAIAATLVDFSVDDRPGRAIRPLARGRRRPSGRRLGAVTNFVLGRVWIFRRHSGHWAAQAVRYALVSAASAGLEHARGTPGARHRRRAVRAARAYCVSIGVSLLWNFPMQRRFVFREGRAT